jgi:hypothetical protein
MAELALGDTPAHVCAALRAHRTTARLTCIDCRQVNLMRFSSVFQRPVPPVPAGEAPVRAAVPQGVPEPAALPELPDELDARVRLVGEWQGLEG